MSGLMFAGVNSTLAGFILLGGALLTLLSAWLLRRGPPGDSTT